MAKITGPQDIPSYLYDLYIQALTEILTDKNVRKRYPFRVPSMQDPGKNPTPLQRAQREIFTKCVSCFNGQPSTGGKTPPDIGPRARTWWFTDAIGSGLWYFDYFMQQSLDTYIAGAIPDWCYNLGRGDSATCESEPDRNFGTREYVEVGNFAGYPFWGWIQKTYPTSKTLRIWIIGVIGEITGEQTYWLDFYTCHNRWVEGYITWNNQPEIGELFHTEELVGIDHKFLEITPPETSSIVVKYRGPDLSACEIASREYVRTDKHPIWIY